MNKTRKLTYSAIIAAITTILSSFVYIPLGFAKIFPVQHFANVLSAVLLGPSYAVLQAFLTSTMRNLMGTGSIFAFPGSMIGALLAALLFSKTKKLGFAALGEVFGTGLLGAIATYPIAILLLGQEAALFGFVPAFMMSSFTGALLGYGLLKILVKNKAFDGMLYSQTN
ncbi:energy coupling factor transporter S component ThiW [Solibacillus silvestris]|uniref:energy coupling factor transporter S component ThiW n=1 Tax=Solibacillus silvestris TaxID=76853 RepID=UPI003F7F6C2F